LRGKRLDFKQKNERFYSVKLSEFVKGFCGISLVGNFLFKFNDLREELSGKRLNTLGSRGVCRGFEERHSERSEVKVGLFRGELIKLINLMICNGK